MATRTSIGQVVRLCGLAARPDLNGAHATVVEPSATEATELKLKDRVKVTTLLAGETLALRRASIEPVEGEAMANAIFSTADFAVVRQPGRDFAWIARRRLLAGKQLWREQPLVAYRFYDFLSDPVVRALHEQLEPFLSQQSYTPAAMQLLGQAADRIADRIYAQLSPCEKRRYMALHDAFSTPPAKTAGGIYRTNTFEREDEEGGILYEVLSRVNHSCCPNVCKEYDGFIAVVTALRDIACGEELCISYIDTTNDMELEKSTRKRREMLSRKYNFTCVCDKCGGLPSSLRMEDESIDESENMSENKQVVIGSSASLATTADSTLV